ncbi:hypothetical protein B566_EDAN018055 [Ephemera danica]|nr:hypothetical protein B566_EDAN018055 [Ephemera danica]
MSGAIEGMSGELDIFERPILQTGVVGGNWYQFKPTSVDADAAQLEFRVPGQGDFYLDLSRTLINVKLKITKADDTPYLAADGIAPTNNLLDTLWSNVKIEMNQKTVSDSRNITAKESHQTASLWYTDEPGKLDDGTNKALVERKKFTDASKTIDLAGKLHCDLFNTSKYLLNGIDMRLIFVKNKIETLLMKESNVAAPKLKILDASLWIRKVKINPSILLAHANNLNHHTAKYPFKRVEMHNYTISSGSQYHTVENMFLGRIPTRVIIGLVSHKAFSGAHEKCAFNFQHFDMNYLTPFKNGEQMFSRPYAPVFDDSEYAYAMPYIQSFINTGNHLADDGYRISMEEWQKGYALFPFDLTPDLSAHEQHWCIQEQGNLRLELGMKTALKEAVTIVVYAEFREVMEIDRTRECSLEYFKV